MWSFISVSFLSNLSNSTMVIIIVRRIILIQLLWIMNFGTQNGPQIKLAFI